MSSTLRMWFYDPSKGNDSYFNSMVAMIDGPYSHTELQFPNGLACTVYMGCAVSLRRRTFDTKYYTLVNVPCSPQQVQAAEAAARTFVSEGYAFSNVAMIGTVFTPANLLRGPKSTFCSKLNADILQSAGLLSHLNTSNVTPSALYRSLATTGPSRQSTVAIDFVPRRKGSGITLLR